jgi:DNA processing protein
VSGIRLTDRQRADWLRLIRCDRIGPATFRELLNHYGSATAALDALPDLARRGGGRALRIPSLADAEREIAAADGVGARLVGLGEPDYPVLLRAVDGPPPLLTIRGAANFSRPTAAIVGSRNASAGGAKMAERLALGLGAADFLIISGLARGVDAAAHRASLAAGTVAVVASGIDRVYPEEHAGLQRQILESGGAVITEMPFGWEPRAHDFPRRNRLISGCSLGVVVVEAAIRSGSLHTARFALDQGREVFAVPGSPLDPRASGTNVLIRDGAVLTRSAADVLEVLQPLLGRHAEAPDSLAEPGERAPAVDIGDDERSRVVSALGSAPVSLDDLIRHTGVSPAAVQLVVLELDIAGRIERHGQQTISLRPPEH